MTIELGQTMHSSPKLPDDEDMRLWHEKRDRHNLAGTKLRDLREVAGISIRHVALRLNSLEHSSLTLSTLCRTISEYEEYGTKPRVTRLVGLLTIYHANDLQAATVIDLYGYTKQTQVIEAFQQARSAASATPNIRRELNENFFKNSRI